MRSGTVIDVSKGYLRNYLIPRKLARRRRGARSRPRSDAWRRPSGLHREASERAQENAALLSAHRPDDLPAGR